MGKKEARKKQLIESLNVSRQLDLKTVTEKFGISEATARRLFAELEEERLAVRVLGGIRIIEESPMAYSYSLRAGQYAREKAAIGKAAAALVQSGDSLFLDSGTTVITLAAAIAERLRAGELERVSIITNSLSMMDIIEDQTQVMLLGGEVRSKRRDVCGYLAEKNLELFHVQRAFLGADALSLSGGFMTSDERTAKINEIVIGRSQQSYVLADSSKFGKEGFMRFASFGEVDMIYTDSGLDHGLLSRFQAKGIEVHTVPLA